MLKTLFITTLILTLSSCVFLEGTQKSNHDAYCSQLRNRMVMSGASANPRTAQIQRDDLNTIDKTYQNEGC